MKPSRTTSLSSSSSSSSSLDGGNTTPTTTKPDEWVFTLRVPSHVPVHSKEEELLPTIQSANSLASGESNFHAGTNNNIDDGETVGLVSSALLPDTYKVIQLRQHQQQPLIEVQQQRQRQQQKRQSSSSSNRKHKIEHTNNNNIRQAGAEESTTTTTATTKTVIEMVGRRATTTSGIINKNNDIECANVIINNKDNDTTTDKNNIPSKEIASSTSISSESLFEMLDVVPDDTKKSERVSLLKAQKSNKNTVYEDYDTVDSNTAGGVFVSKQQRQQQQGWSYESPNWSFRSNHLVSITYCYAWETIPEYTNITRSVFGRWMAKASFCCPNDHIAHQPEYYTEHYTTNDIVAVKQLDAYFVPGIVGECQAIVLYLRPLSFVNSNTTTNNDWDEDDDLPGVPRIWKNAYKRHIQNIENNQRSLLLDSEIKANNNNNNKPTSTPTMKANKKDDNVEMLINDHDGPILIFALSCKQIDPPLLWKFILPKQSNNNNNNNDFNITATTPPPPPIALHTITVLDGKLLCSKNMMRSNNNKSNSQQQQQQQQEQPSKQEPTHIYINGWQSWSFTGSVAKGKKQPKSAMHNIFSRAFNYGGSVPPSVSNVIYPDGAMNNNNNNNQQQQQQFSAYTKPFEHYYISDFFTCITSDETSTMSKTSGARRFSPPTYHQHQLLDERGGPAILLGWLSQREQYGVITSDEELSRFQMHSSAHGQLLVPSQVTTNTNDNDTTTTVSSSSYISTDWAYAQLISPHSYDEEPMANFLHAVAECNHATPLQNGNLLTGWCSWYVFYENITASIMRENVTMLASVRKSHLSTNVAIVDDGYMTAWGDWDSLKPKAFPIGSGLNVVSNDISNHRMRPGLWLAPFAADKHSQVVKDHPDWIIRNDKGIPANSSNCGKFFYGLDATNPAVRAHAYECVRRAVHDWKFSVLKIDFLYAACLEGNGKYDLSMTRAQAMNLALKTIRDAAGPNVFIIGCGCPISSGIGYVDAMRISADTGPGWYPSLPLPWWDDGTLPSLRGMIRNSISRAPMGHRWWHNDPDCIMLGKHTKLTEEEVASAATVVAMTCGMLLLSDDLPKVSRARMNIISKIFPLTGVTAVVLDLHSTNDGLPSLMRLWCTDRYNIHDSFYESLDDSTTMDESTRNGDDANVNRNPFRRNNENADATFFARHASFSLGEEQTEAMKERQRSCIHVTKGMGTWTVVSVSNWSDQAAVVHIPPLAFLPPPKTGWEIGDDNSKDDDLLDDDVESPFPPKQTDSKAAPVKKKAKFYGYHVFAFWSGKYSWLADVEKNSTKMFDDHLLHENPSASGNAFFCKRLLKHETEVFHVKEVVPDLPQYIGSSIHFSCGQEVRYFHATSHDVRIFFKKLYRRHGYAYVYIPRQNTDLVRVIINNSSAGIWNVVGNTPIVDDANGSPRLLGRVIRVAVVIHADGRPHDGEIKIEF